MSAVTPTDRCYNMTRTEQVIQAVRDGARIEPDHGLLRLVDARGREVPAWQNALKSAQRIGNAVADGRSSQ